MLDTIDVMLVGNESLNVAERELDVNGIWNGKNQRGWI